MARKGGHKSYLRAELSPFKEHPMGWSQLLAMVYPSSYEVAMANIGFQWLYGLLRGNPALLTERFFFEKQPYSLESDRRLGDFPVIAVSMPYEIDGLNLIEILRASGIQPLAKDRGRTPILIGGGDALTLNPFPFADIFDLIILGDGEDWAMKFPEISRNMPPGLVPKDTFLDSCALIDGAWIPSRDDGGILRRAYPYRQIPAYSPILTSFGHFRNMFLVEAQRGCPFKCGFCASSWLDEPVFNYPADSILSVYDEYGQGASRVGLVGSAIAEHDELEAIIRGFAERNASVHLSSIRLDRVSGEVVRLLAESGAKSVTFAPETASERLAKKIGKWIPPSDIIEQGRKLAESGFDEMKLYWIVGLPDEKLEDVEVLVSAIEKIAKACEMRISCSVNPFIPKPHSRFAESPMLSHRVLEERFAILKSRLKNVSNLSLEINYSRRSRLSALFSVGGWELSHAIIEMSERGIKGALKEAGIDLDAEIFTPQNPSWKRIA